jgi:hypothetical protein
MPTDPDKPGHEHGPLILPDWIGDLATDDEIDRLLPHEVWPHGQWTTPARLQADADNQDLIDRINATLRENREWFDAHVRPLAR